MKTFEQQSKADLLRQLQDLEAHLPAQINALIRRPHPEAAAALHRNLTGGARLCWELERVLENRQ